MATSIQKQPLMAAILMTVVAAFALLMFSPKQFAGETVGTILDSKAVDLRVTRGRGAVHRKEVRVKYRYVVDGREYIGEAFGETPLYFTSDDTEGVDAALKQYAKGTTAKVYYSEADPSNAVLDPAQPGATVFKWLFPVAAAACWLWVLLSMTRPR
jgi:hypothetical protein